MTKHWSQLSDDSNTDIKFIWEPNRFAFVYTLVRAYAASHDEKYSEAFWTLIEDWAQHNPPNTGPNWMDGQEIALRLMAWTFGFNTFINSPSSTPERKENFTLYIAAQAERIYKNIGYAISTRSNHTISEAFGLWMVGLLFPELKHAEKYLSLGKRLLEQEARNQIFPDGSYSMYSLNYHRFILHIYLYAIRLGEINDPSLRAPLGAKQSPTRFSDDVYQAVTKSITYLSHLINPSTGEMPVYGSNDGALVLPLNNCDFTDYRPLLQLGWYITKKEFLFEPGPWDEDIFWLCNVVRAERSASVVEAQQSKTSFPHGGTYLLRNTDSHTILRCTDFTSRPSHADQLHMDLWIHGHNLAVDAGTYLYSGQGPWRNGLAHTSAHNTVIVDNKDQMTMVSRFTWTNWSKGKVLKHDKNLWQGEHDGYKPVSHKRTVMALDDDRWLVIDHLIANEAHQYALHWLLNDYPFEQKNNSVLLSIDDMKYNVQVGMTEGHGKFSLVRADPNSTRGWRSRYYGHKEPAISAILEAHQKNVTFWTFFRFENDVVEIEGNVLKVNSKKIPLVE
jgi:asparagine synthase (glutamine-hydrolysing)